MYLDPASLHDLDVSSTSSASGPTLLGLVDRTRTRAGREQLRRRLTNPSHSVDEILALQEAHRAVARDAASYRQELDRADLDAVERYLGSDWEVPRGGPGFRRMVEAWWLRLRHRQYLRDIEASRGRVSSLLNSATRLQAKLAAITVTPLQALGTAMAAELGRDEIRELSRLGQLPGVGSSIRFDAIARGPAKAGLARLVEQLGSLEAMWSLGVIADERGWAYPTAGAEFTVVGLVHPFLGARAVANDLRMSGAVRVCFVTGPNMAGKSAFLKAVAVAVLLAHAGCGVPATAMTFCPLGAIFASVQVADSLSQGESFYLAEVRRIKALGTVLRTHGSALAIIDEPFRGTNVHDAAEATVAVLSRLANHPSALVFIASHVGEVVPQIQNDPRIRLVHFAAHLEAGAPTFDYTLREGASSQRLGMALLQREGVLALLDAH